MNTPYDSDSGMNLNSGLTTFASQLIMMPQNYVANRIAPPVSVSHVDGVYRVINPHRALSTAYDTSLAKGEHPPMFDKDMDKKHYETNREGLAYLLTDDEIASGDAEAIDFLKDMSMQCNVFAAKRELALANLILNAGSYHSAAHIIAAAAVWDDPTIVISEDIDDAKRIVKLDSGFNANTLFVSDKVYKAICRNDEVSKFIVPLGGLQFLKEWQIPDWRAFGLNVVNADAINNSDSPLKGESLGFLWEGISPYNDSWAWVGYVDPMPAKNTGSFVTQFAFRPKSISGASTDPLFGMVRVRTFYDNWKEGQVYTVRGNTSIGVTNARAGALLTGVLEESA